jgi:hypothetical protein
MVRHARLHLSPVPILRALLFTGLLAGLLLMTGLVLSGPASAASYAPVAAWSFDEGEGTTTEDFTGDGHTGTVEGAEWGSRQIRRRTPVHPE